MTNEQLIQELNTEATKNKSVYEIGLVLSLRNRSRSTLTASGLNQAMRAEGFKPTISELRHFLVLLAHLGLGELITGKRGQVTGIRNLSHTIQSLGAAITGSKDTLSSYRQRLRQTSLKRPVVRLKQEVRQALPPIGLTLHVRGVPVHIEIPSEGTQVLSEILNRLKIS